MNQTPHKRSALFAGAISAILAIPSMTGCSSHNYVPEQAKTTTTQAPKTEDKQVGAKKNPEAEPTVKDSAPVTKNAVPETKKVEKKSNHPSLVKPTEATSPVVHKNIPTVNHVTIPVVPTIPTPKNEITINRGEDSAIGYMTPISGSSKRVNNEATEVNLKEGIKHVSPIKKETPTKNPQVVLEQVYAEHQALIKQAEADVKDYLTAKKKSDEARVAYEAKKIEASNAHKVAAGKKRDAEQARSTAEATRAKAKELTEKANALRSSLKEEQAKLVGSNSEIKSAKALAQAQEIKAKDAQLAYEKAQKLATEAREKAQRSDEKVRTARAKLETRELEIMKTQERQGFDWKNASARDKSRIISALVFKMTNDYRVEAGLAPLPASWPLIEDAEDYSKVLSDTKVFNHGLAQPNTKAKDNSFFENILQHHFSPDDVDSAESAVKHAVEMFNGWYRSAGHRSNMEGHSFQNGKDFNPMLKFMSVGVHFGKETVTRSWYSINGVPTPPTAREVWKAHGTMRLYLNHAPKDGKDVEELIVPDVPKGVVSDELIAQMDKEREHYKGSWYKVATLESGLHEYDESTKVDGLVGSYKGSSDPAKNNPHVKHVDVVKSPVGEVVDTSAKEKEVEILRAQVSKSANEASNDAQEASKLVREAQQLGATAQAEKTKEAELKAKIATAGQGAIDREEVVANIYRIQGELSQVETHEREAQHKSSEAYQEYVTANKEAERTEALAKTLDKEVSERGAFAKELAAETLKLEGKSKGSQDKVDDHKKVVEEAEKNHDSQENKYS